MSRLHGLVSLLVLLAAAGGCGKSDGPSAPTASIPSGDGKSGDAAQPAGPQETVVQYLTAVKDGDEEAVAGMLTDVARKKTAAANIAVAPPGSATASFSVGDMEFVTENKDTAHVASMWTDVDDQGKPQTLKIVWVVRHEAEGWKIAGMVTRVAPDQPLLVLDFEDPEEVIRRQATAQESIDKKKQAEHPAQAVSAATQADATGPAPGAVPSGSAPAAPPGPVFGTVPPNSAAQPVINPPDQAAGPALQSSERQAERGPAAPANPQR